MPDPLFPVSNYNHPNLCSAIQVDDILLYPLNSSPFLFEKLNLFSDLVEQYKEITILTVGTWDFIWFVCFLEELMFIKKQFASLLCGREGKVLNLPYKEKN